MGACLRTIPPSPSSSTVQPDRAVSSTDPASTTAAAPARKSGPPGIALWGRLAENLLSPGQSKSEATTPRSSGAAFELQLRLDAGKQVLSDKALRRAIGGEGVAAGRSTSSRASGLAKRSWSRSTLVQSFQQAREASKDIAPVKFGADTKEDPESFDSLQCGICLTGPEALECGHAKRYCSNPDCPGAFCTDCFGKYVSGKITDALHFAPPINCPGCKTRVRTSIWAQFVPIKVRSQYMANAAALLSIRCPACDKVCSLLAKVDPAAGTSEAEEAFLSACGLDHDSGLAEWWHAYASGKVSADGLLEAILKVSVKDVPDMPRTERQRLSKLVEHAASLVQDEERRVTLQLAWLRHCPKIHTPCCNAKLCFKCKVQGWHPSMTCEQQQRRFIGSEAGVQPCPQCGVPTQRTEGCNQVQCVCGCSWEWDDTAHGVPLILACSMAPHAGGREDFKALLRALLAGGAALQASDPEDGSGLGSCLVCSTASVTHERFEASDAERLAAALELLHERSAGEVIDLDSRDNDGDTPLSIAISSGNIAAVKALVQHAVTLGPDHMQNLRRANVAAHVRKAMCEALRPLAQDAGRWREGVDALEVYLQMGMLEHAQVVLERHPREEITVTESHADALVSGGIAAIGLWSTLSEMASLDWMEVCKASATSQLRAELTGGWPMSAADVGVMGQLIAVKANVHSQDEEGKTILTEALELEDSAAVGALLAAGAGLDSGGLRDRTLQFLSLSGSKPVVDVLSQTLRKAQQELPLWMCVQFGLDVQVARHLRDLARSTGSESEDEDALLDERLIIACVKRQLLAGAEDPLIGKVEAELRPRLEIAGRDFGGMKKEAATALLLMEMKCCFLFERDPDLSTLRSLLDLRADPNATGGSLSSEAFQRCASICENVSEESEFRFPLFTLAVNTYCTPLGAEAATKLLVQHRADLDQVDEDGDTALAVSFMKENIAVAESLIRAGADVSSAADAWDVYQAWEHPAHLRRLAAVAWGSPTDAWTPKQRLLLGISTEEDVPELLGHFEDCEDAARALLLARGHMEPEQPALVALEGALRETWGDEEFAQAHSRAATSALRAEISGALEGMWRLDCGFAVALLEVGADANARVVLPTVEEEEEEEEDEEEEYDDEEDPDAEADMDDDDEEDDLEHEDSEMLSDHTSEIEIPRAR